MNGHKGGEMSYVCKSGKRERNQSHRELKTLVAVIQLMDLIDKTRQSFIRCVFFHLGGGLQWQSWSVLRTAGF